MAIDREKIKKGIRLLLEGIGQDLDEKTLSETPDRVADAYVEMFSGVDVNPDTLLKVFQEERYDEMVLVKDIPFYSMCEHHLLPFHGLTHVAYIPKQGRITGLSKLARVVEVHARRLQIQERMTADIASTLTRMLKPKGVLVSVEAEHLCMTMRGIKKPGSRAMTNMVTGLFRENAATRAEAMMLIQTRP